MKAILRSINNFSYKLKQSNNQKYNISPKTSNHKLKSINGDGNVVIEDAIVKNLKDYKIYGNTYQNSISGKNLYTINSMRSKTASVIIDGETINISYDNTNGASVKYNEFHTTLSSLIKENEAYSIVCEILEISGTGTLRLNSPNSNVNESQFTLGSAYNISNLTPGQILIENVTALNSFENATRCVRSNIRVNVGQSCHAKLRMSLIKGTVNPNDFVYEPYIGGQPSPNPDYPQEIISCGDNKTGLPLGYTQVDYIESNGTQYIDTGVNADYKLSLKIKLTDILNTQKHMGAMRNNGNGQYIRHHFQTKNSNIQGSIVYYVDTAYYSIKNTSEQTNPHIYNIDVYNNTIHYDNTEPITITRTNFNTQLNYWLFWRNRNENLGAQDKGHFRIYYCKMYVEDILVRDFIPCYRNSDNEVGLYDLVNNVFYTNQGSGVFTYGSVVEKGGYKIPVNVRGKNLLDDKNITAKTRCTVENGIITTLTLSRAQTFYVNINDIVLKAGEELYTTFKVRLKSGTATRIQYGGRLYDGTTYATNGDGTPPYVSNEFAIYSIKQTVTHDIVANQMVFQAENAAEVSDAVYEIKDIIVSTNPIDTYEAYYNETTNIYLDEPLRKIGNYRDNVDFKNSKVIRNIKEVMLNGNNNEDWTFPQTLTNTYRFLSKNGLPNGKNGSFIKIITNKFINGSSPGDNGDYEHIRSASNGYPNYIGLNIFKTRLVEGTLEAFKTWLSANPITVDYILETPIEEDIELPNINLIEGKNIITVGTDIKGAIEIEYYSQEIIDISNYKYNLRKVED